MADRRWVELTGYEFAKVDDRYVILQRGGKYVREYVGNEEVSLDVIGEAKGYDDAVRIVNALRATLPAAEAVTDPEGTDEETR